MLPVSYFLFTFQIAWLIINSEVFSAVKLTHLYFFVFSFQGQHCGTTSFWYELWDIVIQMMLIWMGLSFISNPALADVSIAGFSPSAKTQDTAAAPGDSRYVNIPLWYLKDLYSSGKILQKHSSTVERKDPNFEGGVYFRFLSFTAWAQWTAVCWGGCKTGTFRN